MGNVHDVKEESHLARNANVGTAVNKVCCVVSGGSCDGGGIPAKATDAWGADHMGDAVMEGGEGRQEGKVGLHRRLSP
jgi:hypothetical protein